MILISSPPCPLETPPPGGELDPEMAARAKEKGLKGAALQALKNHGKVKKWTKVRGLGEGLGELGCCCRCRCCWFC